MSRTGDTKMPSGQLAEVLQRAGVTEPRAGARGGLFSEPVLVVNLPLIYDQDGNLRATIKSSSHNPSLAKRLFWTAPWIREVVDVNDQIVLTLEEIGQRTFRSIGTAGTEIGTIIPPRTHFKRWPNHPIQVAEETIGALCYGDRGRGFRAFSVRDADDIELARVTHVKRFRKSNWNVIEIADRMPTALRPLVLSASDCVFRLTSTNA